jgi:hypothetical protein
MSAVMTYAEVKAQFNSEWVLFEDPVTDADLRVLSGKVLWHSKDREEVHHKAMELNPKRSAILFVGDLPKGVGYWLSMCF